MGIVSKDKQVSVVIATYNHAHLISRAIRSVLNQTYQNLELIIVDDGSTDNTEAVVNSIYDERIRYIRHEVNRGQPAARNTGIRASKGELIGFLDSDDRWLPEKLRRQVDKFASASDGTGLVYGGCMVVSEETGKPMARSLPVIRGHSFKEMLKVDFVTSPTPLVKRQCFDKAGLFDETFVVGEDWDMWTRIAEHYEFDFVTEVVAEQFDSRAQMTKDLTKVIQGYLKFIAKYQPCLSENQAILAHHFKIVGQMYLVQRDYGMAKRYFVEAARANPRSVALYIYLMVARSLPCVYIAVRGLSIRLRQLRQRLCTD